MESRNKQSLLRVPSIVVEAIAALVDYLLDDEERHFQGTCDVNQRHIYHDVRAVHSWLESTIPHPKK